MIKTRAGFIRNNFIPLSIIFICMYALYLRLTHLYWHPFSGDELFSLNMMRGTFLDLLRDIQTKEPCSYLSGELYLMYPFFKIFSYNKWGLALPHIAATIIGFYILYLICKRYFRTSWSYLITFILVCFNTTLIKHATEIRVYPVLPTLALGTLYLFLRISDLNFGLNNWQRIAVVIFFVFVILFHVYGFLIFSGSFLFVLLCKYNGKDFWIYCRRAFSLAAIVLFLAAPGWLYSVFGPHGIYTRAGIEVFDYIPNPLYNIIGFLKAIFCNLIGEKNLYFLLLGIFMPFLFSYEERLRQLLFLLCSIIMPICFILFLDLATRYWFLQRQFIWVMPLFAFFLGWTWDSFFVLLKRRKSGVVL